MRNHIQWEDILYAMAIFDEEMKRIEYILRI